MNGDSDLENRFYLEPAAAFVRSNLRAEATDLPQPAAVQLGLDRGLKLHRFKRSTELPRVKRVLGLLRGLTPTSLLDVGSGRGAFLWPLLASFPTLDVTTIDNDAKRATQLAAVADGVRRLTAQRMDVTAMTFDDGSFDVVTVLEVLEHLPEPERGAAEALRVAKRAVIVTVPSHEDDNPHHLHLLDAKRLQALLEAAGARRVTIDGVRGHLVALAMR
jgi:2-polyprenyl-3-methyl-5-hydroxy-6-metoxy-1,4-benzoquinol methylase